MQWWGVLGGWIRGRRVHLHPWALPSGGAEAVQPGRQQADVRQHVQQTGREFHLKGRYARLPHPWLQQLDDHWPPFTSGILSVDKVVQCCAAAWCLRVVTGICTG